MIVIKEKKEYGVKRIDPTKIPPEHIMECRVDGKCYRKKSG